MPIEFRCSQCNQLLRVPEASGGKNARCPKCQALMQVPVPAGGGGFGAPPPSPVEPRAPGGDFPPLSPSSFPEPTPSTAAGNNPFNSVDQGDGRGGGGSAEPPPKNLFGDAGGSFGQAPSNTAANPYASPAAAAYGYQPTMEPSDAGKRTGLPWETQGQNFTTWKETAKLCLTQPNYAFSIMRLNGGIGHSMLYSLIGQGLGLLAILVWYFPLLVLFGILMGDVQAAVLFIGFQLISVLVQGVVFVVLGATLFLLIGGAITHVCLMLVGGARQNYETTVQVISYAQGSTAWLQVVPLVGILIAIVWAIVLEIVGLSRAHDISGGKAALAVFLPLIVCVVLCGAFGVLLAVFIAAAGNM